jgi:tetratricopeptide (TPR) repeat protein
LSGPYTLKIPPVDEIMAESPSELRIEIEKLEQKHAENPGGRYFVPLANAFRKLGAVEHAESLLLDGLRKHPEYLSAHIVLGRCLADRKANAEATEEFRYVLSIDPQNLVALRSLGEIALDQGQPADAAHWFQELISVDPMNEDARRALEQLGTSSLAASAAPAAGWLETMDEEMNGLRRSWPEEPMSEAEESDRHETAFAERSDLDDDEFADFGEADVYRDHAAPSDARIETDLLLDDDQDAPGELVTETIAELYARQGFYTRSADVLRELIRRRGGDEALSRRLEEIERLALASQPDAAGSENIAGQPFAPEETADEFDADVSVEDRDGALPVGDAVRDAEALHETARDSDVEGFEGFDRAEAAPQDVRFEPAGSGVRDGEDSPEPAEEPGESAGQEAGSGPASGWRFEEEQLLDGPPAMQGLEQERSAEGSADSEDAFAASFTHGFPSQQEEGDESRAADAMISEGGGRRWREDEEELTPEVERALEPASEEALLGDDSVEAEPTGTIADYLGSLASWRPGAASGRTPRAALAPSSDSAGTDRLGTGDRGSAPDGASQQESSPQRAESAEAAAPESRPGDTVDWRQEDSFDAPASPASEDAEQTGDSDRFDLEFPTAQPPRPAAAEHEGTGSAAADHFPWEDAAEPEAQRPLSQHRAGDDSGGGTAEPGSFEEYLAFDGEPAGSLPGDSAEQGSTTTAPRTPEAPAAGGAAEEDDDLESFQTWLRSLKR